MNEDVLLVRTGVANVASVSAALRRLGVTPRLSADPGELRSARAVVLPGVGAFAAGMGRLEAEGLVAPLRARVERGEPTLAVCLGLQLLGLEWAEAVVNCQACLRTGSLSTRVSGRLPCLLPVLPQACLTRVSARLLLPPPAAAPGGGTSSSGWRRAAYDWRSQRPVLMAGG